MDRDRYLPKPLVWVDMFQFKTAEAGTVIHTDALGPCIGLVIWDEQRKTALLGHLADAERDKENIQKAVGDFIGLSGTDAIKVYLRGGGIQGDISGGYVEEIEKDRKAVLNILSGAGIEQDKIDVEWMDDYSYCADIEIDVETGDFKCEYTN
ncbi:MAG TPA: hypothetical protein VLE91_02215 [Candidatus Saccharimonadales bacterium]|nr:hypothetical protein [Candidatus Saccharimonadales bacterium]